MRRFLSDAAVNVVAFLLLSLPFLIVAQPYTVSWQNQQEAKR